MRLKCLSFVETAFDGVADVLGSEVVGRRRFRLGLQGMTACAPILAISARKAFECHNQPARSAVGTHPEGRGRAVQIAKLTGQQTFNANPLLGAQFITLGAGHHMAPDKQIWNPINHTSAQK